MPEFVLETSGHWKDLDAFTQGYVEALFFTAGEEPGWFAVGDYVPGKGTPVVPKGFSDLAPETLAVILRDCLEFKNRAAYVEPLLGSDGFPDEATAGRDFWYTRNGHGVGFWDGDWPEPYATDLTAAAKTFGETDAYLGDDGKVYLS